jgi:hypothetical protein
MSYRLLSYYGQGLKTMKTKFQEEQATYPSEIASQLWSYLSDRKKEIAEIHEHLDTTDPYLLGYFDGMKNSLDMADGLIKSFFIPMISSENVR